MTPLYFLYTPQVGVKNPSPEPGFSRETRGGGARTWQNQDFSGNQWGLLIHFREYLVIPPHPAWGQERIAGIPDAQRRVGGGPLPLPAGPNDYLIGL